jgi:hypothetical protein
VSASVRPLKAEELSSLEQMAREFFGAVEVAAEELDYEPSAEAEIRRQRDAGAGL